MARRKTIGGTWISTQGHKVKNMKTVKLTQGQTALVDDADYERVSALKWHASWMPSIQSFYAVRTDCSGVKQRTVRMHRYIMGEPIGMQIDHIDHNTLDNRQKNLRVCNRSQNGMNQKKYKNCSSGYKGVFWCKAAKKWKAQIRIGGKLKHLGRFTDEQDAARAHDHAALKHFGEFALINFS